MRAHVGWIEPDGAAAAERPDIGRFWWIPSIVVGVGGSLAGLETWIVGLLFLAVFAAMLLVERVVVRGRTRTRRGTVHDALPDPRR